MYDYMRYGKRSENSGLSLNKRQKMDETFKLSPFSTLFKRQDTAAR